MADELVVTAETFENEASSPRASADVDNPLAEDGRAAADEREALADLVHDLEEQLAVRAEKLARMKRMARLGDTEVIAEYEKVVAVKESQLEKLKLNLYIDSKAHPSKKHRSQIHQIIEDLGAADELHQSPNTVKTVLDLERRSQDAEKETSEDPIRFVWALVFDIPEDQPDVQETADTDVGDAAGEGEGEGALNARLRISHEAWMACEHIVSSDLSLRHAVSIDQKSLIIAFGAPHRILVEEAAETKILMRLQETKGALEFHEDLLHYYCSSHGGLNEYINGPPTGADSSYGQGYEGLPAGYHDGFHLMPRDPDAVRMHWKHDELLDADSLKYRKKQNEHVFTSALAQRLTMNRLNRVGRYSPDALIQLGGHGKRADIKALKTLVRRSVLKHRDIPAAMLDEALTLFGCYRPASAAVFPQAQGKAVISQIAKMVHTDDQFILKPSGFESHRIKNGAAANVTYDDVKNLLAILERWKFGKGREEVWFGTLKTYFPLHQEKELVYLKNEWGNPKLLFKKCLVGYLRESEPGEDGREMNTFGSCGKERRVFNFPASLVYQPLEEIRDYFGDDVGLYFAWLGQYTRALGMMSITGVLVMAYQPMAAKESGCAFFGCGVSHNPLTIYYSIYVGIWSTLFIESWNRTENELRFLWGTESLSQIEEPRPSFEGELHTNPETGKQVLEVKSPAMQALKLLATAAVSVCFILFTIASAITAQMVRYIAVGECTGTVLEDDSNCADLELKMCDITEGCSVLYPDSIWEQKRYEIISSLLNLTIIGVYGFIFEALADVLTEWENHRTQSEYDNSRVLKNFLFQFVNNYFVLFYIAYMREIEDPISKASHPCHEGNCLPELQMQLIIVFSGKTVGKQIAYTMKPFVYKWKAQCQANSVTKGIMKASAKGTAMLPDTMRAALEEIGNVADNAAGGDDPRGKMKLLKKMRNPYELQAGLMPYEGTFADFNDRVVQFGYLVLFAPAFPLAPFLAFVNNVIEIRTSGFKMCFAFQRPKWRARAGIGSWLAVLSVLGFLACVTNATMITFVGDQDAKSQLLCPVSTTVHGTEGQYHKNGVNTCPEGDTCHYGCNGLMKRGEQWTLWLQFVITEHCVLLMRVMILAVAPSMPKWILDAREVLEYRQGHRYRTQEDIEAEKRLHEEYAARMKDSLRGLRDRLEYKTLDDLHTTFLESDPVCTAPPLPVHTGLACLLVLSAPQVSRLIACVGSFWSHRRK